MLDLKSLFDGALGITLVTLLLALGAMIGLSFAVISREVTGESLLSLWGPALGATIGATATVTAAIYNQRLTERRERLKALNEVLIPLSECSWALMDLHDALRTGRNVHERLARVIKHYDAVKQAPSLPERMNNHLRNEKMFLDYALGRLPQLLTQTSHASEKDDQTAARELCDEVIMAIDRIKADLRKMA